MADLGRLEALAADPAAKPVLEAALRRLGSSDQFSDALRGYLISRGHDPEVTNLVIHCLEERRILDDQKTITTLASRYSGKRVAGKEKIADWLRSKGAPEDLVQQWMASKPDSEQSESALEALRSKRGNNRNRATAGRFLVSRGFDAEAIESALEQFFGSEDPA